MVAAKKKKAFPSLLHSGIVCVIKMEKDEAD
jgi:hypothetical protein